MLLSRLGSLVLGVALIASALAKDSTEKSAPRVIVRSLLAEEIHRDLLFPGRILSRVQTEIYSDGDGVVTKISRPVGGAVRRNDTLLVIQNTDPVYRYAPLKISTPVSGVVSSFAVTEGTQVKRGQLVAFVTDPAKLRVMIEVPAMDLPLVTNGLKGSFGTSGLAQPIEIKVAGVSPAIDPETGTAPAELVLIDPKHAASLRPGIIGQVSLKTESRKGILIPESALGYRDGLPIVKVVEAGVAKVRKVKLGEKIRGNVEILEGVVDAELLILRANRFVADGQKVDTENEKNGA